MFMGNLGHWESSYCHFAAQFGSLTFLWDVRDWRFRRFLLGRVRVGGHYRRMSFVLNTLLSSLEIEWEKSLNISVSVRRAR